jgi:alpha-2-macroglobulin
MKIPSWCLAALVVSLVLAAGPAAAAEGSRLTGRVVDAETLAPVADATVELGSEAGGQGYFRARTDGRGGFALERIPAGRWYALTVGADGYADFVLGSWQFPETQRSVDVVIPLERAGAIEVRLTGPDGRTPLAGAQVSVRSERDAEWWDGFRPAPAPVFTDAQGVARFRDLPRGAWTVSAEAPARLPFEARRVNVRRGETTTVSGRLARPASLSGTVRLADGTPVEGVAVSTQGSAENTGQSGPGGEFTVADLPPGRFHLQVGHDGFEPLAAAAPIALREGETRSGIALTVTPRPPELAFVLEREAFGLDQPVEVGVRSYRVGQTDCELYEIPAAFLTDPARDFRVLTESRDTSGLAAVARWSQVTPDGPPWSWREARMALPEPMLPGAYLLVGRAGALERRTVLFVTDLSLLVKRSPTQLLVSGASLKSGAPVTDARIFVLPARDELPPGQQWSAALRAPAGTPQATDARGLLQLRPAPAGQRLRVVAISQAHGLAVADALLAPAAASGGDRLFLYTDRPIYRPGQTLYWKAFARSAAGEGYSLPAPIGVVATLTGPNGATLDVPAARLSERGSADGAVALPADAPLGEWTLTASAGRARGSATVAVQEYRKPEFRVEVTPDREVYVNGDEVRFRVAATYFFGAPVFGARVRYNLFESRLAGESGGDWEEGGEEEAYGRMLKSGEARTDADGRVALPFTPARATYDRRLTLEVEVLDAAGRQVAARGRVVVGRGEFAVALRPLRRVLATGEAVGVEVTTRDHADRPVRAAVRVTLDQDAWNPIERRYTRSVRPLAEATVNTDSSGHGFVSLSPAPARAGRLEIRARAQDARGAVITADGAVWMWDARLSDYAYRYPSLEAFADRERYQPGDTATVVVNTDVRNAVVLAAIEGRDVEDVQVVPLAGHTGVLRFVMKPEYAPNVFLALHVRRGRDVQTRTLELAVAAARHDLAIALTCDRDEYRPGATAKVAVRTTDAAGQPAPAELSLGVVDEAIYSLRADDTPDPHDVFYGRRPDWVTTVFSFPTLYYGGAAKGEPRDLRKDFRDVAYWAPTVQTDATGRAEVPFAWPDNLTTWRLTARGATAATLVGQATARTRVSRTLVARLAGPRALVAGDEATLVSVTTNRTPAPLTGVEERLEVAGGPLRLGGATTRRTDLPAGGESRGEWPVIATAVPADADTIPPGALRFAAATKSDRDALEVPVPVLARAVALHPHAAGVLEGDAATVTVSLPEALVRPGSSLTLELSPSPAAMALGALDYLTGYEWGCTEQTANAIRPVANLLATAKHLGFTPPRAAALEASLKPATARLLVMQRDDGGWGWWSEGESDPYLTMLALDALARVRLAGAADERLDGALQRGAWRARALLDGVRSADGEAYALMHLTGLLSLPIATEQFPWLKARLEDLGAAVYGERERLGDAGLAMAALGHMSLQRPTEAKALVAALGGRAAHDGGTHWGGGGSAWWSDDVETTAYALSALLAVSPADPRAGDALRWLAAQRRGDHWGSTRATAPVAIALADWMLAHPAEARPDYRLAAEWNGAPLLERAFGTDDLFGRGERVRINGARLRPGANRLVLRRSGVGTAYWSWAAQALVASPGPATDTTRLAVTREYLHAERTADRRGRPRWLATAPAPGAGLRVGEAVLVRLTLHAPAALDHVMIEDPRPAGFEVDALTPEGTEHPWDLHAEARDTRAVFFLGDLPAGDTVIEYLVRPELAGRLVALPTTASGMYEPELEVRGPEQVLEVGAGR